MRLIQRGAFEVFTVTTDTVRLTPSRPTTNNKNSKNSFEAANNYDQVEMWSKVILRPWWYFGHGRKRSHRHTQWIKRICRIIDVCGLFHTAWIWDAISWRRSANDWSRIYSYGRSSQATVKGNWVNVSFRWRFYRPDHQTNSVKALKESSWSSRSGLNPTRTTPPCCNNTTLGNCLYTQRKGPMWQTQSVGPVRTAHVSVLWTVNIVSHNTAQRSSDNIPSLPPDNHHNSDVV